MYKFRTLATLLASSAYCYAVPALAANDSEIIVTATGVEQDIEDTGTAISVIDTADILEQQIISIADILQELPGVKVTQIGRASCRERV